MQCRHIDASFPRLSCLSPGVSPACATHWGHKRGLLPQQTPAKPSGFPASVSILRLQRREGQMANLLAEEMIPGPDSGPPTCFL